MKNRQITVLPTAGSNKILILDLVPICPKHLIHMKYRLKGLKRAKHKKHTVSQNYFCSWNQYSHQSVLVLVGALHNGCAECPGMFAHCNAWIGAVERKSSWFSAVIHPKFAGSSMCCCGNTRPTTWWKAQKATRWWWWCCSGRAQGQIQGKKSE